MPQIESERPWQLSDETSVRSKSFSRSGDFTKGYIYPDSEHVFSVGLSEATDQNVLEYALVQQYTIVTKDGDFADLITHLGFPPKVIWIRRGNCTAEEIENLLHNNLDSISSQQENPQTGLLVIF
jgi:predicted nuclease of predicted toxin-antitoxin system